MALCGGETEPGGIGSLESIPGILKRLQFTGLCSVGRDFIVAGSVSQDRKSA